MPNQETLTRRDFLRLTVAGTGAALLGAACGRRPEATPAATAIPTEVPPTATSAPSATPTETPPTATATIEPTPTTEPTPSPEELEARAIEAYIDTFPTDIIADETTRQKMREILRNTKNIEPTKHDLGWVMGGFKYPTIQVEMCYYGRVEAETMIAGEPYLIYYGLFGNLSGETGSVQLDGALFQMGAINPKGRLIGSAAKVYYASGNAVVKTSQSSIDQFDQLYLGKILTLKVAHNEDYLDFFERKLTDYAWQEKVSLDPNYIKLTIERVGLELAKEEYRDSLKRGKLSPKSPYVYIASVLIEPTQKV